MAGFELLMPADPAWSGLAKAMTAAGAAPLDLDLDRLEDLLLLTEELLADALGAPDATMLTVDVTVEGDILRLRVASDRAPERSPFADTVIRALAGEDHQEPGGSATEIRFRAGTSR